LLTFQYQQARQSAQQLVLDDNAKRVRMQLFAPLALLIPAAATGGQLAGTLVSLCMS
jgi:hypothetical protein